MAGSEKLGLSWSPWRVGVKEIVEVDLGCPLSEISLTA